MRPTLFDSQLHTPETVAEINRLGTLCREFAPNTRINMMVYGGCLIGFPLIISYLFFSHQLPDDPLFAVAFFPICGLIALIFLVLLIVTYLGRNRRVYVYEHGLIVVRNNGIEAIRWDEIAVVWHRVKKRSRYGYSHTYILECRDGSTFQLGGFATDQKLGAIIEQKTAELLLPEAQRAYQQGQALSFGPFTVDQSGLTYKKKTLPWNEVAKIQLTESSLY